MPVTININGLTLVHRGSEGTAMATLPDVCKTPSAAGPVPLPYPNVAVSADLAKGTRTITVDGGNMAAHRDSELARSTGDEAGTAGGVVSSTVMMEATWLTYSMDVCLEGKGACRLTDKLLMNHANTMCCAGFLQKFLRGPKGPTECAALLARIILNIGEGMLGKTDGIRGLDERMRQQVTGAGSPYAPFDREPNPKIGFDKGSNSWMRHDREIKVQQEVLKTFWTPTESTVEAARHHPPAQPSGPTNRAPNPKTGAGRSPPRSLYNRAVYPGERLASRWGSPRSRSVLLFVHSTDPPAKPRPERPPLLPGPGSLPWRARDGTSLTFGALA